MLVALKLEFTVRSCRPAYYKELTSFPGSPEHEMYTHGEPGIFSHMIMT